MEISLVLTSKCTAACDHCSTSCGPRRREALGAGELARWMTEAAAIDDGEDLCFHFTGGEPFLDFDGLLAAVAHGKRLGGRVSCVTNAFWARTPQIARDRLATLRAAGLASLSVSTSRFHAQYVPLSNVRIALEAATRLGLTTELKGAIVRSDLETGGLHEQWQSALDADVISIFPVIPCLRDGASLPDAEYYRKDGVPTDRCPAEMLCIEPDGRAMSCCGQAPGSGFLDVGDARAEPLSVIHERFGRAARQRLLREEGPIAFARAAREAGAGHLLRDAYAGPCDLCVHIATQPELRRIADEYTAAVARDPDLPHHNPVPSKRTARRVPVKEEELDRLQQIIARAAREPELRDALVAAPIQAAQTVVNVGLSADQQQVVESIIRELRRFGGNPDLHPDDAMNWAAGLLARCRLTSESLRWQVLFMDIPQNQRWVVQLLDIPRNESPKRKKSRKQARWSVVLKDIPRNQKPKKKKKKKSKGKRK